VNSKVASRMLQLDNVAGMYEAEQPPQAVMQFPPLRRKYKR
jgi:hypothetical protein